MTEAYSQPLRMGRCVEASATVGKYDNVRRLWEDRVNGHFLRPHLRALLREKARRGEGLRVLDLGCGVGDGLDWIRGVPRSGCRASGECSPGLVREETLEEYVGVDINEDLLNEARRRHEPSEQVRFLRADLSKGLPVEIAESHRSFDLYLSSYATLSHLDDQQCVRILADSCRHADGYALFVGDWLGRYSHEWQDLWGDLSQPDCFIDYRMSYLYSSSERDNLPIPSFPLRLMTRERVLDTVRRAAGEAGKPVRTLTIFDRSILTGRHTDTREYNRACRPLRSAVNMLFEPEVQTDLEDLLVEYTPRQGFDQLNRFFAGLFRASNEIVTYVMRLVRGEDPSSVEVPVSLREPRGQEPICRAIRRLAAQPGPLGSRRVRDNLLEPLLAHALWRLETECQEGIGAGHSIAAVVAIGDRAST